MVPCRHKARAFTFVKVLSWLLAFLLVPPLVAGAPGPPFLPQKPVDGSAGLSRDWKRIKTSNFDAISNAPVADVKKVLDQLETFRSSLVTRFLTLSTKAPVPTLVVVFKDDVAFAPFKPRDEKGRKREFVGGYFLDGADMNHIVLPSRNRSGNFLRVIFHEYYHYVAHRNLPDVPVWLDEGLAEFYSTCEFDPENGQSLIGSVLPGHLQLLRMDRLIPLEQLLSREGAMKLLHDRDSRRVAVFYAQSWALVHYLMLGQNASRQAQIKDYLDCIKQRMPIEQAFQKAFGMTFDKMQTELEAYVAKSAFSAMRVTQSPEASMRGFLTVALSALEVEYAQGDLLLRVGAYPEAERVLTKVQALQPSYTSAQIALAAVRSAQERHREAIDILRPVVASGSDNFRARLTLAAAFLETEQYEDALREYDRAATINDQTTAPLLGKSYAALALGRQTESDEAMDRLQKLEFSPAWYDARAYEAFKRGKYSAAVRDAHSYIDKAGRGAESAPYMAFLGAICYLRLGQAAEAHKLLEEVRQELAAGSWQASIMDFMQGRIRADRLLSRASDVYERTEAHAYVGMRALHEGRRDEALTHLRWVKEKGSKNYVEYGMAVAELKRLQGDPPPISKTGSISTFEWRKPVFAQASECRGRTAGF